MSYGRPGPGAQPAYDVPAYGSTHKRHPQQSLVRLDHMAGEVAMPRMTAAHYPVQADLTRVDGRAAIGERIIVAGRVLDENGRGVAGAMVEIWQANAAGRYAHPRDQHDAPLDPNFHGGGRVFADTEGHYRFITIRPGAYPWRNHDNAWRPAHIHLSLFGQGFVQRLITQFYFEGDPLLPHDPIFNAIPDAAARQRLLARFDPGLTRPEFALGYRFDVVLRGREATPMENAS